MRNERNLETRVVKTVAYFSSYISLTVMLSLMCITTVFEKPMQKIVQEEGPEADLCLDVEYFLSANVLVYMGSSLIDLVILYKCSRRD